MKGGSEMTAPFKKISEVEWESHFMTDRGKIRWIYTREKDESPITVMQIKLDKGVTLPDHVHRDQPDLVYVLEGKATMFIDGTGEFPVEPGMVIQVPPNTKHSIRRIEQDLLIYNSFALAPST
jgi:quercetin dioxygenase-like cupin family protein